MKKKLYIKKIIVVSAFLSCFMAVQGQTLKTKRGLCYNDLNSAELSQLKKSQVSWGYNWAASEENPDIGGEDFSFMPMIWGAGKDFEDMYSRAEAYLASHPEAEFLLGFNEPMMKNNYGGCDLTPGEAAVLWLRLENLAEKYKVALVSPALTWGFEPLTGDGKIYGAPEEWMNAWISEFKTLYGREPRFDYLALHSYMDYPSAVTWFCNFYSDYFKKPVLLTEFCAWDSDQNQTPHKSLEGQISSMTQKVEALEANPNVAGYAWFMSHAEVSKVPFNSIFLAKGVDGSLTELGKIYLQQSRLDKSRWFTAGERIPAYCYVSSSNYNTTVGEKGEDGVRFNTPLGIAVNTDKKTEKTIPLEIGDFTSRRFADYQLRIEESKTYKLTLRYQTDKEQQFFVNADGKEILHSVLVPAKKWTEASFNIQLEEGEHILQLKSLGNAKSVKIVSFLLK
ncbi:hypothetical protein MSI_12920 [Treponema sp. JC4]|uniref:glycosyl hydrolase n=1 Tax=Treponema sp. JC4 TaxID=1124982 RepID=UPI00025B0C39|nr:glycosyl hydrolase [Treponema sp. JC4]EID85167.1 hypothetical protein MSI_12920 [Treponema sp. JC4]